MLRTNKQTDKQTDSNVLPTPTDRVGVGNEVDEMIVKVDSKDRAMRIDMIGNGVNQYA